MSLLLCAQLGGCTTVFRANLGDGCGDHGTFFRRSNVSYSSCCSCRSLLNLRSSMCEYGLPSVQSHSWSNRVEEYIHTDVHFNLARAVRIVARETATINELGDVTAAAAQELPRRCSTVTVHAMMGGYLSVMTDAGSDAATVWLLTFITLSCSEGPWHSPTATPAFTSKARMHCCTRYMYTVCTQK